MIVSPDLLKLLRCPRCGFATAHLLKADSLGLSCDAGHRFPLTGGFADLRPDDLKAPAPAAQGSEIHF